MKSCFELFEIERFLVEKYKGSVVIKEKEYLEISFPNDVFLITEEEKSNIKKIYDIVPNADKYDRYLGVSFVISDNGIEEITFLGQNFHLRCLVSVLFELEISGMDDEQLQVFNFARSEVKYFFNKTQE